MINNLGDRLKLQREKNNMSRQQIASLIGVTASTIGLYETGERIPSTQILVKLSAQYKVSIDYLIGNDISNYTTISLEGLSDKQIQSIRTIVEGLRNSINA